MTKKHLWMGIFLLIAGSQLGATDCGQVIRDSGFDLWCGDSLCAWKLERGQVKKVPTWNEGDPGVSLVGDDVAIEQLTPVASSDANGGCIEFDLIANVDADTDVELNVDLDGDGSIDHSERIPSSKWQPLTFVLPIQGSYDGIRFEIAKTGNGNAVVAQIQAQTSTGCGGLSPILAGPMPDGATTCDVDTDCASGHCVNSSGLFGQGTCVGCRGDSDCSSGDVCGLGSPLTPVLAIPQECVAPAGKQLGDDCGEGSECATGICSVRVCSTCAGATCTDGEACGPAWPSEGSFGFTPYVCSPNAGVRKFGEPCASNDDCASGTCNGTPRSQCDDGRACATAADCPFGGIDTTDPLQQGPCNPVGIQGGSCQ
ncbi:MAG TPA: hypothetical protein VMJ10_29495 [Kofleriaceae bacterium]|nr:hypothetical protein [Kofleriaceae bacterium]